MRCVYWCLAGALLCSPLSCGSPIATEDTKQAAPAARTPAVPAPVPASAPAPTPKVQAPAAPVTAPAPLAQAPAPASGGWHYVHGKAGRTLYDSFAALFPNDEAGKLLADQLAAHFKRIFLFKMNMAQTLRPGDEFAFLYEKTDQTTDGLRLLAARIGSQSLDTHFEAYFFKGPGDCCGGHHYDAQGVEVQKRLKNSPIAEFEQVTALLFDRRPRHEGVDFKAPIGTPVTLPFDAVVLETKPRGSRGNGRYIKLRYTESGKEALFLHLDAIDPQVVPGRALKAGAALGAVGNTGHSFAPHLHYQIQSGKRQPLDPYRIHGALERRLPSAAMAEFSAQVARYKAAVAAGGAK